MYLDNVLIKLRRQYKKDEVVMFALNSIKELKKQIIKEQSELNKYKEYLKKSKIEIENINKTNSLLCEEIDKLKNDKKKCYKRIKDLTSIKA